MSNDLEVEKMYDRNGRLSAEKPKSGSGVFRNFGENGNITIEGWMHNGQPSGYVKMFDGDGKTHLFTKFWYNIKYLSKKRYHALCDKDPSLPRFDEVQEYNFMAEDLKRERKQQREEAKKIKCQDNTKARQKIEDFCQNLIQQERTLEAISWLSKGENILGELQTNKESLRLVRKLSQLGIEKIWAIEVQSDERGGDCGKLVLELPDDIKKRTRIFRWSDKQAREQGFAPDVDIGQKYMFVMLD